MKLRYYHCLFGSAQTCYYHCGELHSVSTLFSRLVVTSLVHNYTSSFPEFIAHVCVTSLYDQMKG